MKRISEEHAHQFLQEMKKLGLTVGDIRNLTEKPEYIRLLDILASMVKMVNTTSYLNSKPWVLTSEEQSPLDELTILGAPNQYVRLHNDVRHFILVPLAKSQDRFKGGLVEAFTSSEIMPIGDDFVVERLGTDFFCEQQERAIFESMIRKCRHGLIDLVKLHDFGYNKLNSIPPKYLLELEEKAKELAENFSAARVGYTEYIPVAYGGPHPMRRPDEKDPALVRARYHEAVAICTSACLRDFYNSQEDDYKKEVVEAILDGYGDGGEWAVHPLSRTLGLLADADFVNCFREWNSDHYLRAKNLAQRVIEEWATHPTRGPVPHMNEVGQRAEITQMFKDIKELYPGITLPQLYQGYLRG